MEETRCTGREEKRRMSKEEKKLTDNSVSCIPDHVDALRASKIGAAFYTISPT